MHSDWFNGIDVLQGKWQHGEKVGYCYPSGLEKTLCKWEIYVPLVTKGLKPRCIGTMRSQSQSQSINQHSTNNKINLGQTHYSTRLHVSTLHEGQLISVDIIKVVGWNSMVKIASPYGPDSPGLNLGGDKIFHTCLEQHWGPTSLLYNGYRVSFPRIRRLGFSSCHLPPSSAEVEERVIPLLPSRPS
jgi:hypothetical protein